LLRIILKVLILITNYLLIENIVNHDNLIIEVQVFI
jgi:hypothetical protein